MRDQPQFQKVDAKWAVFVPEMDAAQEGEYVNVTKKDGSTKEVRLGGYIQVTEDGRLFKIGVPDITRNSSPPSDITTPGAFGYDGRIYIVKPTVDKKRMYAKRVIEINGQRLNEKGEVVEIELEYEKGAMGFLREEHRLSKDRARELSLRYGRCIVCGRRLKQATSVERGIGPVCWARLAA